MVEADVAYRDRAQKRSRSSLLKYTPPSYGKHPPSKSCLMVTFNDPARLCYCHAVRSSQVDREVNAGQRPAATHTACTLLAPRRQESSLLISSTHRWVDSIGITSSFYRACNFAEADDLKGWLGCRKRIPIPSKSWQSTVHSMAIRQTCRLRVCVIVGARSLCWLRMRQSSHASHGRHGMFVE